MDRAEIERVLNGAERTLAKGEKVDLRRLGFWRAVEAVKEHREWIEAYADRISAIDREAFRHSTWIDVPLNLGLTGLATGTLIGLALVGGAFVTPPPVNGLMILAGAGVLIAATHDLAHWAVGRAVGIRFTELFIAQPSRPQPGIKIDYATYLRTPPRARAWMHASGALVTKAVPFALIPLAAAARTPRWVAVVLALLGVAQIATDVLFSTKSSDWKRFRREMRNARPEGSPEGSR
jgi:hypothetical protein